jgi:hypothetical protein
MFLSCSDGKSPVTSRIVAASRYPDFDRSALQFVTKTRFSAREFLFDGRQVAACALWWLVYPSLDDGEEGGEPGGVMGDANGVEGGPLPPLPPPPPAPLAPQIVPPAALEKLRISGVKQIEPDLETKAQISADHRDRVVASLKLCVAVDGIVSAVSLLKSSQYDAYDAKLAADIKNWKYKPFLVNGKAVPVCTAVTFIYSQHDTPSGSAAP